MTVERFVINPGTGPIARANVRSARANMRRFVADIGLDGVVIGGREEEDEGRYRFWLKLGKRKVVVDMPGIPLARVRYLGAAGQSILGFPRLYVDGSSWVWKYAVEAARDILTGAQ